MSNNHWAKSLPYLVPNWGTVAEDIRPYKRSSSLEPNHEIGVGGIGIFDGLAHNEIKKCNYVTRNATLPFWINNNRKADPFPFLNTMCFSTSNRMFSYNSNVIRSFQLSLDDKRFKRNDILNFDMKTPHQFSLDEFSQTSPFAWKSSAFREHVCEEPILDLKHYDYHDRYLLMTYSPTMLKIYDCDQYGGLEPRVEYGENSQLFNLGNMLETCDMNFDFKDLILLNFRDDNVVYTYDSQTDRIVYENRAIQADPSDNRNHLVGVHWTENHNPFLYFFGTHRELFVGDIRDVNSRRLAQTKDNSNIRIFELFNTMIPNPVEGNQLIVATDLNIIFYDMRFPKKNVFQFRHMIDNKLVRKLHCALVKIDGEPRLLLFMSNFSTCALATMDVKTCFQPIMKHSLIHVNTPRDIGKLFPSFHTGDLLISGAQIVPGTLFNSQVQNDAFTLFLNLSNGDIWSQDFFIYPDDYIHPGKGLHESSFHQIPYVEQFDKHTLNYLKTAEEYSEKRVLPSLGSFSNPDKHHGSYLLEQELRLLTIQDRTSEVVPNHETPPTLKYSPEDPVDFDAMLNLWKTNPNLRKNFRDLTCKLTDHLVDAIEKNNRDYNDEDELD